MTTPTVKIPKLCQHRGTGQAYVRRAGVAAGLQATSASPRWWNGTPPSDPARNRGGGSPQEHVYISESIEDSLLTM